MKRLLSIALLAVSSVAFGATLAPVQLLSPSGSTTGQAIVSTGASSPPAWGNVSIATLTGILPVANGGTNASSASGTALDNISGFAGTGFLTRTGAGAYAFQSATNGITLGNLAQLPANTVLANATNGTANVTAFAMPNCGLSSSVTWTAGTGFTCTSAAAGVFSTITATTTNSTNTVTVTDTGTSGANIKLVGNGGTTPNKSIRANGGQFQVVNSAYSTAIMSLDDSGNLTSNSLITSGTAPAGSVGEYVTNNTSSGVALSTAATTNLISISLTAGKWDVTGDVSITGAGAAVLTNTVGGISTTSATIGSLGTFWQFLTTFTSNAIVNSPTPTVHLVLGSTTTVWLVALGTFSSGTASAQGVIRAIRVP
ncbi:hypothetical protein [Paraburkholderia sartisoli]|uniref:Uncharacterized protein n=1 Tax=Paraburkholderia sartisoli TaxID=83784 RepID=A0A1H4HSK4_9BURK|nr:hypothetical protein [Paraburkholderia sartisoli]SEB24823.1 hypothetical protein SAMN05192564_11551 [Paraburkholderia sartisoli]